MCNTLPLMQAPIYIFIVGIDLHFVEQACTCIAELQAVMMATNLIRDVASIYSGQAANDKPF